MVNRLKLTALQEIQVDYNPELERILSYPHWRHRIPLGEQLCTPGTRMSEEWEMVHLPKSLKGKSFLDAGANDGMYCFLAESKGAEKVIASDIYKDASNGWHHQDGWNTEGIISAKNYLKSRIEIESCSVYDLTQIQGKFDYIYFSNVFYWLRDPLLALENLASKCNEVLHIREDMSHLKGGPVLELVHDYASKRPSGYYWANRAFFEKFLKAQGFKTIEFYPVDEMRINEMRIVRFAKAFIASGKVKFDSPFALEGQKIESDIRGVVTLWLNGKYFIAGKGWFNADDVESGGMVFHPDSLNSSKNKMKYLLRDLKGQLPGVEIHRNYSIIAKR
jgi:hypothetical protein